MKANQIIAASAFATLALAVGVICVALAAVVDAEGATSPVSGPALRGRVVDTAGAPVAWASVEVRYSSVEHGPGVLTREDGTFMLPIRAEGTLRVRRVGYHAWSGAYSLADTARDFSIQLDPAPRPIAGVEVAALRRPGRSVDLTLPVERIDAGELRARTQPFPVLTARLRETPEVTTIGRDEYNAAPAVRGLARFRTVMFFDGARINSDREIGPTASFIDPATIQSVEVVRGPGSVLYGSDAIGGVVLLRSEDTPQGGWAQAGWSSVNRGFRTASGVGRNVGKAKISLSGSHTQAGDYALPGKPYPWSSDARLAQNSGYQRSTGRVSASSDRLEASAFYSLGENIGRPAREAEEFSVPREEHILASLRWRSPDARRPLEAGGYLHPTSWTAEVLEPRGSGVRAQHRTYSSVDWGGVLSKASTHSRGSWIAGLQADARSGVKIHRRLVDRDSVGAVTGEQLNRWVDGVSVGQAGAFAHGLVRTGIAQWNAGARVDAAWRAGSARDVRRLIPTGQAGVSVEVAPQIVLSGDLASAFREPTVTELFFSGRRPAGYIEGNQMLLPERSYQADLGARWSNRGLYVGASGFGIVVGEYIGLRTRAVGSGGGPDTLTYYNAPRAVLVGCALEAGNATPWRHLSGRAFIDVARASDQDGAPLADAHPLRGLLEVRWNRASTETALRWRASLAHHRTGPNERAVPGYGIIGLHAATPLGSGVVLDLSVENLLDQEYYERVDPVAYPGPGRALGLAFRWSQRS